MKRKLSNTDISLRAPFLYQGEVREHLRAIKQRGNYKLAKKLVEKTILENSHWLDESGWDYIIPIPPHYLRTGKRGFHLPYLLGDAIARRAMGRALSIDEKSILKLCNPFFGRAQKGLSREARFQNAAGKMRLNIRDNQLTHRSLLLIDDITTTGATLLAAKRLVETQQPLRIETATMAYQENY